MRPRRLTYAMISLHALSGIVFIINAVLIFFWGDKSFVSFMRIRTRGGATGSNDSLTISHEFASSPDIKFLFWTRQNPDVADELVELDAALVKKTHYCGRKDTKVLIHGYQDTGTTSWVLRLRDIWLQHEDCNVISVDWRKLANTFPFYNVAAANTKAVGYLTADLLRLLVTHEGALLERCHLVGFSLGAQVAGHAGYDLKGQLARITGLDPAGFLFHVVPITEKLDRSDARFVDVIHTAGLWIGTDEAIGHVDFYPNAGRHPQPGCQDEGLDLQCSHQRAHGLFAESVTSPVGFKSFKCPSWQEFSSGQCDLSQVDTNWMGYPSNASLPGVFYLRTHDRPPFVIPAT